MEGVFSGEATGGVRHSDRWDGVGVAVHQRVPTAHLLKASTRGHDSQTAAASGAGRTAGREKRLTEDGEGESANQHDGGLGSVSVDDCSQTT